MKQIAVSFRVLLLWMLTTSSAFAVDYLTDVKPLLERKCYACHGASKQQSGLRVDTAAALLQGGDSGSPITPGKPEESVLLDVLTGAAGFRMPPENEGAALTEQELALIRQWIAEGAEAPSQEEPQADPATWWSYQPIARPTVPTVKELEWCRSPIDNFVAAERQKHQLPHVAEATKPVWLRRVYIDLIGLPPTRAELHRFLADESTDAYETVVEDLLSRPQYGERWGRHWMDVWRYSDWYGSRGGNEIRYSQRHIWRWRDWIIASLNQDKGYDQMIREMLAADELAQNDPNLLPATGYLGRNWYKFDRDVWLFETVERTGEAFLGLTFRCARCHDHKFDPISQEEYYRFRAFFEPHQIRTDPISALTPTEKDPKFGDVPLDGIPLVYDEVLDAPTYRFERGDNRHPDKSKPLEPGVPAALGNQQLNITSVTLPPETWYPMLRPALRASLIEKAAQSIIAAEEKLRTAESTFAAAQDLWQVAQQSPPAAASEPRIFLHDQFAEPKADVWKVVSGDWVYENQRLVQKAVTSFATMVTQANHPRDFHVRLRYRPLTAGSYRSIGFSFDYQDQGNSQDVYTSTNDQRQSVQAFHRIGGNQVYPEAGIVYTPLTVNEEATLDVDVAGSQLTIFVNGEQKLDYTIPVPRRDGKFALWVHEGSAEFLELKISAHADSLETLQQRAQEAERAVALARKELEIASAEKISIESRIAASVATYVDRDTNRAQQLAREAAATEKHVAVLKAELECETCDRGNSEAAKQARSAAQATLEAARQAAAMPSEGFAPVGSQYPQQSTGRRTALANWIASRSNPRTARVAVNHLWSRHFGQPLVATTENFGLNGRKPTHPELLDWLASELIANGWRMKPLHRQIVLSSTYRMSSSSADSPSASAMDPDNVYLWRMNPRRMEAEVVRDSTLYLAGRLNLQIGGPEILETEGENVLRRSVYFRNTPNEKMLMLEVFDVADPNSCYRRKESVIPHQSLALMNSGLAIDHARIMAEQLAAAPGDFIEAAFETVLARSPTELERNRCQQFLDEQTKLNVTDDPSGLFASGGSAKRSPASDPLQRSRENLVHVLLMHNDFITVR